MSQEDNFRVLLETVVQQNIDGCVALILVERLSGGASQETYRLRIKKGNGEGEIACSQESSRRRVSREGPPAPWVRCGGPTHDKREISRGAGARGLLCASAP